MKHTIGLIAPQEPETLALLTQQQITWQQARRQAIRLLLSSQPALNVVAGITIRYGIWPSLAIRFVRQAQRILHPQTTARQDYLEYLSDCGDAAGTPDEIAFYGALPGPGDDALIGVDFRPPASASHSVDGMQLFFLPQAETFYLSVPIANPGGTPGHISGVPVLFADAEAAELRRLTTGAGDLRVIDLPNQELIWWQGTPHLVVGFDPDDCVAAFTALRKPSRAGKVTAAVVATLALQSSLPVIGMAMAASPAQTFQIAAAQTPTVKVLDSATGRQLGGVKLVAEDGKVLARSDDSGTMVLPNNYSHYSLFNLVKEGYQFMLLESAQLTPHNLLRVELSPVTAKGAASARTTAVAPPKVPTKPKTLTAAVQTATPKPVSPQASKPVAKPQVSTTVKPTASVAANPPAKIAAKPPVIIAAKPSVKPPVLVAAKPQVVVPAKPSAKPVMMAAKPSAKPLAMTVAIKPPTTVVAKAVMPVTKPIAPPPIQHQTVKAVTTPIKAPATTQQQAPVKALPTTNKPTKLAAPMAQAAQTPRTADSARTYRVRKGDTLWDIAEAQMGSGHRWLSIYQLNKGTLSSPQQISPGQTLQIPARTTVVTAAAAAKKFKITVRPGDTLSLIAKKRLGRLDRWREIYDLNRSVLRNPRLIFPGQQLWIPGT
ncbi:MAG: LysM peptidoglycan-binding domain-containing protein [Candidatus Sericytochromatia bacterium]|nr:LysM peptidoglycan-binding domain-containing protein [Candidatus Sericytochromatia bacterium]